MEKSTKIIHWTPRIIGILAILFVSMFALDSFGGDKTVWEQIKEFLIHLTPTYILIFFLVIAWKWEIVGGILFIIFGSALTPYIYIKNLNMNHDVWMSIGIISTITIPFIIVGILFIVSYFKKHNVVLKPSSDG